MAENMLKAKIYEIKINLVFFVFPNCRSTVEVILQRFESAVEFFFQGTKFGIRFEFGIKI